MPEGTVTRATGPEAQPKLGQIACGNGDILSFFNTKNLQDGEPVIFDIIRTKLVLKASIGDEEYHYKGMLPIAVLPLDFEIDERDGKKKWPKKLRERWEEEWKGYGSDEEIEQKLGVKLSRSVKRHPHCK
jgi:hypothetical protein